MKVDVCDRAVAFATRIVRLSGELEKNAGVSRLLCAQLWNSATILIANVEDAQSAQGAQGGADAVSKMKIARKEACDIHYWLSVLVATGILPEEELATLIHECAETVSRIRASIAETREAA